MRLPLTLLLILLASPVLASGFEPEAQLTAGTPLNVWQSHAAIAATNNGPVLAWTEHTGFIDATAKIRTAAANRLPVPDAEVTALADTQRVIVPKAVASIGAETLLAWNAGHAFAQLLDANGRPIGERLDLGDATKDAPVAVAASADRYLVVWLTMAEVRAALLDRDGRVVVAPFRLAEVPRPPQPTDWELVATSVSAASDGERFLATWTLDGRCRFLLPAICSFVPDARIHAAVVSADGSVGTESEVAPNVDGLAEHDVAWNGSEYALFYNVRNGGLRARRIARDGAAVAEVIALTHINDVRPRVAWDGFAYTVVFSRNSLLTASRFSRDLVETTLGTLARERTPLDEYDVAARDGRVYIAAAGQGRVFLWRGTFFPPRTRRTR